MCSSTEGVNSNIEILDHNSLSFNNFNIFSFSRPDKPLNKPLVPKPFLRPPSPLHWYLLRETSSITHHTHTRSILKSKIPTFSGAREEGLKAALVQSGRAARKGSV
ncbi:hypothetical protein E2C01_056445 [Portunus trituberculatus]|uniref:Uncharacterized protein n=1 Tax=Portunus trituberculatus TaxID=210409 RepID=A0A5B7GQC8_PORTR|nr:hypothetical protein [Portunus trituberculatus]